LPLVLQTHAEETVQEKNAQAVHVELRKACKIFQPGVKNTVGIRTVASALPATNQEVMETQCTTIQTTHLMWVCSKLITSTGRAATVEIHHVLLKKTLIVQFTFMEDMETHLKLGAHTLRVDAEIYGLMISI
jgi:hypothetical protein